MKVVRLEAENFKRLQAVEIAPDGNVVLVGGKNGSGKSSVLDAIYVALKGRAVGPPKPVRNGEERCLIKLDLGDLVVTRTFTVKEGGQFTDSLKVENAEGLRYSSPQAVLDALLGEVGFDPFEFVQMKPDSQADTLLRMVPLPIDLDELAELDASDFAKRRDINRDVVSARAQVEAIPKEAVPTDLPDRQSLVDQLGNAADTNTRIEHERAARERTENTLRLMDEDTAAKRETARSLRQQADELEAAAKAQEERHGAMVAEFEALPPLDEPVDTDAIRRQLHEAEATLAAVERQKRRATLEEQLGQLSAASQALTDAMAKREKDRQAALAKAKMPIEGLAFAVDEKGKPTVQFNGVPFEQASTAEQLRASTAIAMAGNPELRVLRVKDGALLDDDSMKLLAEMAKAEDFQLWVEVVSTGEGVGIVMENGTVVEAKPAAAAKKKEGELL